MTIKVTSSTDGQVAETQTETQSSEDPSAPEADASEQEAPSESGTEEQKESKETAEPGESEDESKDDGDESESEDGDEDSKDEAGAKEEKPKKKSGFQRRVEKLNARITAERERNRELEERLARLENSAGGKEPDKPEAKVESTSADGKPSPDDFDTHAEYEEAYIEWRLDQRDKERTEAERKQRLKTEHETTLQAHYDRVKSFADKTEDFQEVLAEVDDIIPSPTIQESLISSENGPELMYALAKDREEYARICKLPPLAAARALGAFEAKLQSAPSGESKPEPKPKPKAPAPITPVKSKSGKYSKDINDPSLSYKEFEALREKQERERLSG